MTAFLVLSTEQDAISFGSTWLVIFAAVACEHGAAVSIPAHDILRAMCDALHASARKSNSIAILKFKADRVGFRGSAASVQDALLLSMLRVAARCDTVPKEIVTAVKDVNEVSGRHIRRVCVQVDYY